MKRTVKLSALGCAAALAPAMALAAPAEVQRRDHYVEVRSAAPSMNGQTARVYVREVSAPGVAATKGIVLFIHGAGTPAEVSFDVPHGDYSWMAYLARAGFRVFSMDMEGYGPSTRPPPMSDPCNAPGPAQAQLIPGTLAAPCAAPFKSAVTTLQSDVADIVAVVDSLLARNGATKLSIVAWSLGGPRSFAYAMAHPDKVERLAVLAPAYNRAAPTTAPNPIPTPAAPMTLQSRADFMANWERQAPCPGQYEPAVAASVWSEMLKSDPVGAGWGPGVRRAPAVPTWGFNREAAARMRTPYLMVAGVHDDQVPPERVRELYEDLGSPEKVLVDLACSSHNAMWEKNRLLLFKASLDWLATGQVGGTSRGVVRLGY